VDVTGYPTAGLVQIRSESRMAVSHLARCVCGSLRVCCNGEPDSVSLCHCLACQRRTGSIYGIAAFFNRDRIEVTGARSDFVRPSDSGHDVTFHFCPRCGSTVFWEPARKPDLIAVAVGCLSEPSFQRPGKSVYQQHRHHWVRDVS
jgi:hypothetical protein